MAPPGSGFSYGAPLGLSDALAVANAPAVDLSTVGSSLSFATATTVVPFAGGTPTGVSLVSNVCLSSDGPWLTATVAGLGGAPVQLQGTLVDVLGSGGDVSYIFRGTLSPTGSLTGPLAGALQFVADVTVVEPDNTAQLTVVFLSPSAADQASSPAAADPVADGSAPATAGSSSGALVTTTAPPASAPDDQSVAASLAALLPGQWGAPSAIGGSAAGGIGGAIGGFTGAGGGHSAPGAGSAAASTVLFP